MPDDAALLRVLAEIQRRGAIGRGPLTDAIAHAEHFARACPPSATMIDLGSGGGLPGLVVAVRRPELRIGLVERRAKRADLLRYAVRSLELADRVDVRECDVQDLIDEGIDPVDVVTARSFAPPLTTLAMAASFVVPGGVVLISDPPSGEPRWRSDQLDQLGFLDEGRFGAVRRFRRRNLG